MKVLTLGNGFIADHLPYPISRMRFDTHPYMDSFLDLQKPDVIINCIGKTGRPNIDWCESHKEETVLANTIVPIMLAEACAKHSIHLIHVASGCIYSGESPHFQYVVPQYVANADAIKVDLGWRETDSANPQSFYSKTKYAADLVLGDMKNVATLRIRMPVSEKNVPRNLINKLRGYDKIIDIQNSMTFMSDFVQCVDWFIEGERTGIWNITNPGSLSAVDIMQEYQKYVPQHQFSVINESQLDDITIAKRSNCFLDTSKLWQAGFRMTSAKEALQQCMHEYMERQHV